MIVHKTSIEILMELEYQIIEQNFLEFQLFVASQSERINKKRRNGYIYLTVGTSIFAIYFYLDDNINLTNYLGLLAVAFGLFYRKYFKWKYNIE
jgi:hypothetical protein